MPDKAQAPLAGLVEAAAGSAIEPAATITSADAKARTGDRAGALAQYAGFLAKFPESARRHEVRAKQARLLAEGEAPDDLREAIELYEKLLLDVPLSGLRRRGRGAAAGAGAEGRAAAQLRRGPRRRASAASWRRSATSWRAAATPGSSATSTSSSRCSRPRPTAARALFLKGTAIFKQRKRAKSRPVFRSVRGGVPQGRTWPKGHPRQGAVPGRPRPLRRGRVRARGQAVHQAVADEFPDHSYADDSLLLAGESWAEKGDKPRERQAYEGMLERFCGGDMAFEARRRLLVLALTQDRPADALKLADEGLTQKGLDLRERAKLHYFRGRGLHRLGRTDDAVAAWLDVVATAPLELSWPSGHVTPARGRRRAAARARSRRSRSRRRPGRGAPRPARPRRRPSGALLLARLGLGDEAREELSDAKIDGWPAAAVLAQAGLYGESQRLLGALGSGWRQSPPAGPTASCGRSPTPLAFSDLVRAGEGAHQVPWFLTFAIMQTESRFEPGVTSWAGARGLVQLMPATAKDLARQAGVDGFNEARLFDPSLNLDLGTLYLGNLVRRFGERRVRGAAGDPQLQRGRRRGRQVARQAQGLGLRPLHRGDPLRRDPRLHPVGARALAQLPVAARPAELTAAQRLPYVPLTLPSRARGVQAGPVDHG